MRKGQKATKPYQKRKEHKNGVANVGVGLTLGISQIAALKTISEHTGQGVSELVREAIDKYLNKDESIQTKTTYNADTEKYYLYIVTPRGLQEVGKADTLEEIEVIEDSLKSKQAVL